MLNKQDTISKQLKNNLKNLIGILPSLLFSQVVTELISKSQKKGKENMLTKKILEIVLENTDNVSGLHLHQEAALSTLQHQSKPF